MRGIRSISTHHEICSFLCLNRVTRINVIILRLVRRHSVCWALENLTVWTWTWFSQRVTDGEVLTRRPVTRWQHDLFVIPLRPEETVCLLWSQYMRYYNVRNHSNVKSHQVSSRWWSVEQQQGMKHWYWFWYWYWYWCLYNALTTVLK